MPSSDKPRVALFVTCLVNVFRPVVAEASVELLRQAGCDVEVPLQQSCCGQPGYNAGDIPSARPLARNAIGTFESYDYVVLPSGSCAGMLIDHYPRLFADDEAWRQRARDLASKTFEINCFLNDVLHWSPPRRGLPGSETFSYHDSCAGLRELGIRQQPRRLLQGGRGIELSELESTDVCCGFGGSFCAKLPHISVAMADDKLDQAVAAGARTLLGGDLGCLLHLAGRAAFRGLELDLRHVVEVLAGRDDVPAMGRERD